MDVIGLGMLSFLDYVVGRFEHQDKQLEKAAAQLDAQAKRMEEMVCERTQTRLEMEREKTQTRLEMDTEMQVMKDTMQKEVQTLETKIENMRDKTPPLTAAQEKDRRCMEMHEIAKMAAAMRVDADDEQLDARIARIMQAKRSKNLTAVAMVDPNPRKRKASTEDEDDEASTKIPSPKRKKTAKKNEKEATSESGSDVKDTEEDSDDSSEDDMHEGKTKCTESGCNKWVKNLKSHKSSMQRMGFIMLQVCARPGCVYQTNNKRNLTRHMTVMHT
jgi:hypothetical protein